MIRVSALLPAAVLGTILAVPGLLMAGTTVTTGGTSGSPGLSFDSKAPIEITANTLEVKDKSSVATFNGNVRVVQADMILKSDTLEVHYKGRGMARVTGGDSAGGASGIERIDAKGHVFITSKDDTAQSNTAVYQPDKGIVTMKGNVLLTRGKNVLKGSQLVIDLKNGRSTLKGGGASGRVKGVLIPEQKQGAKAAKPQ